VALAALVDAAGSVDGSDVRSNLAAVSELAARVSALDRDPVVRGHAEEVVARVHEAMVGTIQSAIGRQRVAMIEVLERPE
jgi:hypothetical protein